MGNEEVTWGDTIAATVIALVLTCRCFKLSSELILSLDERPQLYMPTTLHGTVRSSRNSRCRTPREPSFAHLFEPLRANSVLFWTTL